MYQHLSSKRFLHTIAIGTPGYSGPGTGKSATVVALVDQLLQDNPAPRIKLITFTRAATAELAKKVSGHPAAATKQRGGPSDRKGTVGAFHGDGNHEVRTLKRRSVVPWVDWLPVTK